MLWDRHVQDATLGPIVLLTTPPLPSASAWLGPLVAWNIRCIVWLARRPWRRSVAGMFYGRASQLLEPKSRHTTTRSRR